MRRWAQDRRRLWRTAVRRACSGPGRPCRIADPPTPAAMTLIETILSDVDCIEDVLLCGAGNGGRPRHDATLRQALLDHAAQLARVGMPGTAALVLGLVERIDEAAGHHPVRPSERHRVR